MKTPLYWLIAALLLMVGAPFLAVTFAGDAGMAVCFILFFAANPLFAILCGLFAGKSVKERWFLPLCTAILFLLGAWIFFEPLETAFLLYCGIYLAFGLIAMVLRAVFKK